MYRLLVLVFLLLFTQCKNEDTTVNKNTLAIETEEEKKIRQDSIVSKYVTNCAKTFNYRLQMQKWQNCLDEGLKEDSTIAYLWQQKAMPYFKTKKYEVGMEYIDKAVKYDPKQWLSYRAFIKCIFAKIYKDAIKDFELCLQKEGNSYVMDHTYNFYIALSNLQLNEFERAESIFRKDIETQEKELGEAHFLDLFYYGISMLEQGKYEEAIVQFDKSLSKYAQFSDAKLYKSICLLNLDRKEEATLLSIEAKQDAELGYTITEDNAIYEIYPYQFRW